jgi:hypothetical protein
MIRLDPVERAPRHPTSGLSAGSTATGFHTAPVVEELHLDARRGLLRLLIAHVPEAFNLAEDAADRIQASWSARRCGSSTPRDALAVLGCPTGRLSWPSDTEAVDGNGSAVRWSRRCDEYYPDQET